MGLISLGAIPQRWCNHLCLRPLRGWVGAYAECLVARAPRGAYGLERRDAGTALTTRAATLWLSAHEHFLPAAISTAKSKGPPMLGSSEKLGRAAAPRPQTEVTNQVRRVRPVRSTVEGKSDRAFARDSLSAATSRDDNMVRPLTKLTPWLSAGRITRGRAAVSPSGAGRMPPAARSVYPVTTTPKTASVTSTPVLGSAGPARRARPNMPTSGVVLT